jgi:hypothetical protein
MPFPFTLPTTSAIHLPAFVSSQTHPSLPLHASTQRGVFRAALKKYKRLPPHTQSGHLPHVVDVITAYVPYVLALADALASRPVTTNNVNYNVQVRLTKPLDIEWRPTLGVGVIGGPAPRVSVGSLDYEVFFVLATLANAYTLMARAALQPLYDTSAAFPDAPARTTAITTAGKHLRAAAEVYTYLCSRAAQFPPTHAPPCPDVAPPTLRALASLALAEAALVAVLKDDPYPAVVAQGRNKSDKEWMYRAPEIPKVRAHLFARLCLGASELAAEASSLCMSASSSSKNAGGKIGDVLVRYLEDLRLASRARASRFLGIDADLSGDMGLALGWLHVAFAELGAEPPGEDDRNKKSGGGGGGLSIGRFRKEWSEKREDKRIEKDGMWGLDANRLEERRVVEMLEAKWSKINDTVSGSRPNQTQTRPSLYSSRNHRIGQTSN